jgi:hypothetical protein
LVELARIVAHRCFAARAISAIISAATLRAVAVSVSGVFAARFRYSMAMGTCEPVVLGGDVI